MFAVYILSNFKRTVLYIGVTNNSERRILEHKCSVSKESFSNKYNVRYLVFLEYFESIKDAIQREKQLKSWNRQWKIDLIEKYNPNWDDLAEEYSPDPESRPG